MRAVALTDVGIKRENNEDFYLFNEQQKVFIVTDGMGGYQAGEIAAEIAARSIMQQFEEKRLVHFDAEIRSLLKNANESIQQHVQSNPDCKGMGTTAIVVMIDDTTIWVSNVGDSRCYGYKGGEVTQLSEDHSLVAELVKMGSISAEEAETHPDRNIVTSALGVDREFDIYINQYDKNQFSHIILCSDGLSSMISSKELAHTIQEVSFEQIPKALVDLANEHGGRDNITVICIEL